MTKERKRVILGLVLGIVAIAAIAGYLVWNKPHRDAANEKGTRITAAALQQAYATDEAAANAKYLDKTLEVSGTVAATEKNQDGKTVLYLDDPLSGVGCTLREAGTTKKDGDAVVVKGFCSGNSGMGVAMRECIIVE
jgi:hypothetical protein